VTAKTITSPYQSTDVVTIVEEENGTVARFALGFQDDSLSISGPTLPINSTAAIEEPYCKFSGEGDYVIRVDHLLILQFKRRWSWHDTDHAIRE